MGGSAFGSRRAKEFRPGAGAELSFGFGEFFLGVGFNAGGVVIAFDPAVIAMFLDGQEFLIDAAEKRNGGLKLGKVSRGGLSVGLAEEEFGEPNGGGLEADLGQFRRAVAAVIFEEVIPAEAVLEGVLVEHAPFGIAAMSDPVGDIAFGNSNPELGEGGDDSAVVNAVGNHAANHIAFVLGKGGDGAGARASVEDRRP